MEKITNIVVIIGLLFLFSLALSDDSAFTNMSSTNKGYYLDISTQTALANSTNYSLLISHKLFSSQTGDNNYTLYLGIFFPHKLPPVVNINSSVSIGRVPLPVHFQAYAYDPDGGDIKSWNWTIYNSTNDLVYNTTDSEFNYTFTDVDVYSVYVTVWDDDGQSTTNSTAVGACANTNDESIEPDLVIPQSGLHMSQEPFFVEGERVNASAMIFNTGSAAEFNYSVDDTGKTLKSGTLSLEGCSDVDISTSWKVEYIGSIYHTLTAVADPSNAVGEENETNNLASLGFKVYPGGSCNISSDPIEIADKNCETKAADNSMFCPSGDASKCCGPTNATITGYGGNPKYLVTDCKVYGDKVYTCEVSGQSANFQTNFSSNNDGNQTFTMNITFGDGSKCEANTTVLVTETGMTLTAPDVAVDRIELIPEPKLNYNSKIYAYISNHGHDTANSILVNATLDGGEFGTKAISSLAPGDSTKVYLGEWTPHKPDDTGQHLIIVTAYHASLDSDWGNNQKTLSVSVGTQRKLGSLAEVPEYPGPVLVLVLGLLVMVELVRRRFTE